MLHGCVIMGSYWNHLCMLFFGELKLNSKSTQTQLKNIINMREILAAGELWEFVKNANKSHNKNSINILSSIKIKQIYDPLGFETGFETCTDQYKTCTDQYKTRMIWRILKFFF